MQYDVTQLTMDLIQEDALKGLLDSIPHRKLADLVLILRIGWGNSPITYDMLASFGISEEELFKDAFESVPVRCPAVFRPLKEVFSEMGMPVLEEEAEDSGLMVATTDSFVKGASVLMYPGFLDKVAEQMGGDYYVIPSSRHEVLILYDNGSYDPEELSRMVAEVNGHIVAKEDRLSDHAYHYRSAERTFRIGTD